MTYFLGHTQQFKHVYPLFSLWIRHTFQRAAFFIPWFFQVPRKGWTWTTMGFKPFIIFIIFLRFLMRFYGKSPLNDNKSKMSFDIGTRTTDVSFFKLDLISPLFYMFMFFFFYISREIKFILFCDFCSRWKKMHIF